MNTFIIAFTGFWVGVIIVALIVCIWTITEKIYLRLKWRYEDNKEKKRIKVYQFKYCFMAAVKDDPFCERNERIIFNTRNEMETFIKAKNVNEAVVEFFKTKPFDTLIRKVNEVG